MVTPDHEEEACEGGRGEVASDQILPEIGQTERRGDVGPLTVPMRIGNLIAPYVVHGRNLMSLRWFLNS
ncbi:hypothetical protein CSIRO_0049 [Bradyrhizobiaceae bacterium SG-6C]|nr:hypothetical protein CSIRO_0049 [Bradyrhizobiaceae bacterium SG-6C]